MSWRNSKTKSEMPLQCEDDCVENARRLVDDVKKLVEKNQDAARDVCHIIRVTREIAQQKLGGPYDTFYQHWLFQPRIH